MKRIYILILSLFCLCLLGCGNGNQVNNGMEQDLKKQEFEMKEKCKKYNEEWNEHVKNFYGGGGTVFYSSLYNSCIGEFTSYYHGDDPIYGLIDEKRYGFTDVLQNKSLMSCHIIDYREYDKEDLIYFDIYDKNLPDRGNKTCSDYYHYLNDYLSK